MLLKFEAFSRIPGLYTYTCTTCITKGLEKVPNYGPKVTENVQMGKFAPTKWFNTNLVKIYSLRTQGYEIRG